MSQLLSISSGTALAAEIHFTKSHALSLGSPLPGTHQVIEDKDSTITVNLRQLYRAILSP